MTSAMPWRVAIGKEIRALLPMWATAMIALLLSRALQRLGMGNPEWAIFLLGTFALGALSIGHEYSSGTVTMVLAQPVSRRKVLAAKLAALVIVFLPLAGWMAVRSVSSATPWNLYAATVLLPIGLALLVTPWMTMLARGPLGGIVFTIAATLAVITSSGLWDRVIGGVLGGGWRLTPNPFVVFLAVGGVLGWRAFMRLESIDGDRDLRVSVGSTSRDLPHATRRSALAALVFKELQLQQTTFFVAALSLVAIACLMWAEHARYSFAQGLPFPASMLHLAVVPILAGALSSAEERHLGTLEWQVLQPVAMWKQWTVKVAIALALGMVLGTGGLSVIRWIDPAADLAIGIKAGPDAFWSVHFTTIGLTLVSLYVSSFSTSGLRAALVAVPVIGALVVLSTSLIVSVSPSVVGFTALSRALVPLVENWHRGRFTAAETVWAIRLVPFAVTLSMAALAWLLLRFGLVNHRTAARGSRRLLAQAGYVGVWWIASVLVVGATSAWYWTGTPNYPSAAERQARADALARYNRWQPALTRIVAGFNGRVGVCASDGSARLFACVNSRDRFPMQSVMKLPVAVAVLDAVDHGTLTLDEPIVVHKEDLSVYVQPIAKLVGPDGFKTTIDDLLRRAIVDSDNAAADILIAKLGGPSAVHAVLSRKGLDNIHVNRDEKQLQSEINGLEWREAYLDPPTFDRAAAAVPPDKRDAAFQAYLKDERDTSTPLAMSVLLDFLATGQLVSKPSCAHLVDILKQTTTFPDRLKAGVPEGWTIGHKTGTSGDWRGVTAATNDVGILFGPNGETITLAVFIADSSAPAADRAALMATIARAVVAGYK